jgi:hypothetical protein
VRTSRCSPARSETAVQQRLQDLIAPFDVAALFSGRDRRRVRVVLRSHS